tara:strand:+ start:2401 stop:2691 length:291 start_codon:yes stop_codon:yes gene_type:complete
MVWGTPNITQPYELLTYAHVTTEYMFGNVIVLAIFIVALLAMLSRNSDPAQAFAGSSFITFILALLLTPLEIVNNVIFYLTMLATIGSICWLLWRK